MSLWFFIQYVFCKVDIYISYLCVDKENYLFYLGKWDKGAKFQNFTYLESLPRHAASNVETFY
jgi:hypothetical protein